MSDIRPDQSNVDVRLDQYYDETDYLSEEELEELDREPEKHWKVFDRVHNIRLDKVLSIACDCGKLLTAGFPGGFICHNCDTKYKTEIKEEK